MMDEGESGSVQVEDAGRGWLDEFWSVVLALPLLLAFIPGAQGFVSRGFQIISQDAPGWYLTAVAGGMAWAFGRRAVPPFLDKITRR